MSKNGLHLITPTSVAKTGTGSTATINANGSVTFSSCVTLSLNNVFSSDYDNYMVVVRFTSNDNIYLVARLRVGGVNNTEALYTAQEIVASGTSVTASRATSQTGALLAGSNLTQRCGSIGYFYGPNLAQPTVYRCVNVNDASSARIYDFAGTHNKSVAYDGFTLDGGNVATITGLVGVYGMRK